MSCCRGVTAAGAPCTAKAKIGEFCGRHAGVAMRTATAAARTATESAKQATLFTKADAELSEAMKHVRAATAAASAAVHMDQEIIRNLGILGLNSRKHNAATIKRAFRDHAMATHPDKFVLHEEKVRKAAEEKFKQLRAAFENLRKKLGL